MVDTDDVTGQLVERRFGPAFVNAMRQRYGHRPASHRQLTYDIAVTDEFEPWRLWLEEQLAQLPQTEADELAQCIWLDEHFWPKIFELATGAALRELGFDVAYERAWGHLTPDWTILTPNGDPACFVEVHTDQPPQRTFGIIRAWKELEQRIADIPVPVVLMLEQPDGPPKPPDAGTAKKIAQHLRTSLLRLEPPRRLSAHGYSFRIASDFYGRQIPSPNGLHAQLASPSGIAGRVTALDLANGATKKVSKYRELATSYDVPFIVALGAHRFTGVNLQDLDDLLTGQPTMRFQFNAGDTFIGEATVRLDQPDQWVMPPDLAGVLWISNEFPFAMSSRANEAARRPMPPPFRRTQAEV